MALAATAIAWIRSFELPWIMFMGVGFLAFILIIASRVKLVMRTITERKLHAYIAELESQLAAVLERNAFEEMKHRDQMDAQANLVSEMREANFNNRR